jgi:hypothetical protein
MGISVFPASGGGLQKYSQTFYKSGTWTKPAGVKQVNVTCIGAGGGAYGQESYPNGGGAGGYIKTDVDVTGISSATVLIGAGGTSAAGSTGGPGIVSDGGNTLFGNIVTAYGGQGTGADWNLSSGTGSTAADSGRSENIQIKTNSFDKFDYIWLKRTLDSSSGTNAIYKIDMHQYSRYTVAYGAGKFVSFNSTNGSITYSSDGITWTNINPLDASNATFHVVYNGTNFVASVAGTRNTAYYSADGITWATTTLPSTAQWRGVTTGNGITIVYDKTGTSSNSAVSTNGGTTWTAVTLPAITAGSIIYSNGHFYLKTESSAFVWRSTDGVTWTAEGSMSTSWNLGNIDYYNNLYVASQHSSNTGSGGFYFTSTNGTTWTQRNWSTVLPGATTPINSATYSKGNVVFIKDAWYTVIYAQNTGVNAAGYIYKTTDGVNWTYVKSYFKGTTQTSSYTPNQGFGADIFEVSPGRFYIPWSDYYGGNSNRYCTGMILLADTFVGGQEGYKFTSTVSGTALSISSASAFSSHGGFSATGVLLPGLGTLEGYCVGGAGPINNTALGGGTSYYWKKANIGCGADSPNGASNHSLPVRTGGDGLVVVEWWA